MAALLAECLPSSQLNRPPHTLVKSKSKSVLRLTTKSHTRYNLMRQRQQHKLDLFCLKKRERAASRLLTFCFCSARAWLHHFLPSVLPLLRLAQIFPLLLPHRSQGNHIVSSSDFLTEEKRVSSTLSETLYQTYLDFSLSICKF